jgi:hypothetical protein
MSNELLNPQFLKVKVAIKIKYFDNTGAVSALFLSFYYSHHFMTGSGVVIRYLLSADVDFPFP